MKVGLSSFSAGKKISFCFDINFFAEVMFAACLDDFNSKHVWKVWDSNKNVIGRIEGNYFNTGTAFFYFVNDDGKKTIPVFQGKEHKLNFIEYLISKNHL